MKFVGVYNAHNASGDFVCQFDGVLFGESPVNPSHDGVCFFRLLRGSISEQVTYFCNLHKALQGIDLSGLSAVVIPNGDMTNHAYQSDFCQQIKAAHPEIMTIGIGDCSPSTDAHIDCGLVEARKPFKKTLNIAADYSEPDLDLYNFMKKLEPLAYEAAPDSARERAGLSRPAFVPIPSKLKPEIV